MQALVQIIIKVLFNFIIDKRNKKNKYSYICFILNNNVSVALSNGDFSFGVRARHRTSSTTATTTTTATVTPTLPTGNNCILFVYTLF